MPENEEVKPEVDPNRVLRASYPSNSNKNKKPEAKDDKPVKKVEKVIEGVAIKQKPSLSKRIRLAFTGDDAKSVGEYLIFEVALPALKTTISDMASQGVERMLFGNDARSRGAGNRRPGRVDYNVISQNRGTNREEPRVNVLSQKDRSTHSFDNIILATRPDAETVLQSLIDLIEQYDMATVSDFYDLVDITGSFADDKWGWFDLRGADITRVRDGWILDLPATKPIR